MPLYEYRCTGCGKLAEVRHGFDEVNTQACAACNGALTKNFNAGGIVFKGSGFYVNYSRSGKSSSSSSSAAGSGNAGASSGDTAGGAPSTPAPASAAAPSTTPSSPAASSG